MLKRCHQATNHIRAELGHDGQRGPFHDTQPLWRGILLVTDQRPRVTKCRTTFVLWQCWIVLERVRIQKNTRGQSQQQSNQIDFNIALLRNSSRLTQCITLDAMLRRVRGCAL